MKSRLIHCSKQLSNGEPSALKQRLEQLAESAGPSKLDDKAGPQDALPYNQIALHNKLERISSKKENFDYQHQQALSVSKLPSYADKQSKELAMARPWRGTESAFDGSLRMLNDSIKPLKTTKKRSATIISPPIPLKSRVHNAKEDVLNYRLSKIDSENKGKIEKEDDDDGWSERYRETLLGPSMLLNDSFASVDNSIKSLADQKIMEAQKRGQFENLKGRGKSLDEGYSKVENMFIDRTEYQLNNILKRQDALPPWIEKQGGVEVQIKSFRLELDSEWLRWSINEFIDCHPHKDTEFLVKRMKQYAEAELQGYQDEGSKLRSSRWLATRGKFIGAKIKQLNDSIRGYNLQAPLASQKRYLLKRVELDKCYKRVAPNLPTALKKHIERPQGASSTTSKLGFNDLPQRDFVYQAEAEPLSSLFANLFTFKK